MLAEIGIMIGLYIIIRYISFIARKDTPLIISIFSLIFAVITAIIVFDLLIRGLTGGPAPPR